MIELKHLSKTYRTQEKEIVALEDINLTINDEEVKTFIAETYNGAVVAIF